MTGRLVLKRDGDGNYVTPDGAYLISKGVGYTFCDNPHPLGRGGGYCDGFEEHEYFIWGVLEVDPATGAEVEVSPEFDTKREAAEWLADHLGLEMPPVRRRARRRAPAAASAPATAPAVPSSDPREIPVTRLLAGETVEAIERGDGAFVTPLGFPGRVAAVRDNGDGTVTVTLDTEHWDKNRHVPAGWMVRVASA